MKPSSKKRRLSKSEEQKDNSIKYISCKDILNFNEDYLTDHKRKNMIIHKPMDINIGGKDFINGNKLGEGTYSSVYKLIYKDNPRDNRHALAIKIYKSPKIFKNAAIKEINSLSELIDCKYIVDILTYFKITNNHIALVTPFYDLNLLSYMETYLRYSIVSYDNYMLVLTSLLKASSYMIKHGISSTDIKPENIFINTKMDGTIEKVVLGDFSSPLYLKKKTEEYFNYHIITKYYRPPDIIFKFDIKHLKYMDLWSIACVMSEFYNRSILFNSDPDDRKLEESNENLFLKQVSLLGLPPLSYFEKYDIDLCEKYSYINSEKFQKYKEPSEKLNEKFSKMPFGLELIVKFLNWDPDNRPTPEFALEYIEERL